MNQQPTLPRSSLLQSSLLQPSLPRGGQPGSLKLAIDIDDTLSLTAWHWAERMMGLFPLPERTVAGLISQYRRASLVPEWGHPEAQNLFSSWRICEEITLSYSPVAGAQHALKVLSERIELEYLTMRPRSLYAATQAWLKLHGFPSAEIVTCPDSIDYPLRAAWKADYLHRSCPPLVGIVEDDERVALSLPEGYQGTVFLFSHLTAPRSDIAVIPCPDWDAVNRAIEAAIPRQLQVNVE